MTKIPQLPTADGFVGIYSAWAVLWGLLFLTVPLSYVYIALVLLREICRSYPSLLLEASPPNSYVPSRILNSLVYYMQYRSWRPAEVWCWLEGAFYILVKIKIKWLQHKDPLEASLSAAPLLELDERATLWRRMIDADVGSDPVGFLTGWFFDSCPIEEITKYDVRDFCAWSMFEGRHQEHLTNDELRQLEAFVDEAEHRIGLQLYGAADTSDDNDDDDEEVTEDEPNAEQRVADQGGEEEATTDAAVIDAEEDVDTLRPRVDTNDEVPPQSPIRRTRGNPRSSRRRMSPLRRNRNRAYEAPDWKSTLPRPKKRKYNIPRSTPVWHIVLVWIANNRVPLLEHAWLNSR